MQSNNRQNKNKVRIPNILSTNNELRLIERIYEGDNRAFSTLYENYRPKFLGCFQQFYHGIEHGEQIVDLYQDSCLKLYNQIITRKIFVQDKNIYIKNREGKINILSAKLDTYLIGIGKYSYLEMKRGEHKYVDFDPFENVLSIEDFTPTDDIEANPLFEIADDPYFDDEVKFRVVREIVNEMGYPCKDIFTYTYFGEDGQRMKGEEIAEKMGYSSTDVVKNQKSRCHKKFKEAYEDALSKK